jgi:hypothetical protein
VTSDPPPPCPRTLERAAVVAHDRTMPTNDG